MNYIQHIQATLAQASIDEEVTNAILAEKNILSIILHILENIADNYLLHRLLVLLINMLNSNKAKTKEILFQSNNTRSNTSIDNGSILSILEHIIEEKEQMTPNFIDIINEILSLLMN